MAIISSDILNGPHSFGPSVFWLSNPNNTLTNNVAVDAFSGFWIQPESAPTGTLCASDCSSSNLYAGTSSHVVYNPRHAPWGRVKNNHVHGSYQGFTSCPELGGSDGMETPYNIWLVDELTMYGITLGTFFFFLCVFILLFVSPLLFVSIFTVLSQ